MRKKQNSLQLLALSTSTHVEGAFEIGAIYGAMFPSGYVGATTTLPTLGFVFGAARFPNTLQLGINYGNLTEVQVMISL
jgi:hypothetical protein